MNLVGVCGRRGVRRVRPVLCAVALIAPVAGLAQDTAQEGSVTLFDSGGFTVKAGAAVGLQVVGQNQAFWNLGETFAPDAGYDPDPVWGEGYVEPFLTFRGSLGGVETYGKVSVLASGNLGTDVFDVTDASAVEVEDAFVGLRGDGFDLSVGAQPYRLGTGMLLADGGADGFERGALIFGPRQAWEMTGIVRISAGATRAEAFYLDPRELESGDTATLIGGAALMQEIGPGRSFGVGGGEVIGSEALWVQAAPGGEGPPVFIENGRDGLRFLSAWGTWTLDERLTIAADAALQSSDVQDMTAWGARVQATYSLTGAALQPRLGYTFQTFSGDDPDTPELERFDPLFYDGSPAAWGSGANASLVFLNTNIAAHQLWASATLSPRDFVTFRYYHVTANELLSPLQFGQGTRLDPDSVAVIAGVTDRRLSDDLYLEYTRMLTASAFLTGGIGVSVPGAGIRDLRGGARDVWTGGFVNLVVQF